MRRSLLTAALAALALLAAGAAAARALYRAYPVQVSVFVALTRNYVRSWGAPPGATRTELNPAYQGVAEAAPALLTVGDDGPQNMLRGGKRPPSPS
jgi:ABC-type sulfate transport system substrate-binding protein